MNVAKLTSKLSTCVSKQVGCVFMKDKRIILSSYNGVAPNKKHCNVIFKQDFDRKKHHEWSKLNELHAEQNGISFAAKNGISLNKSTMFITLSPCIDCAKQILASGIKEVFYKDVYDLDKSGLKFLKKHGVKCKRLNVEDETQTL